MIAHLKKWWASYGTLLAGAVVYFLDPSVQAFLKAHPVYTGLGYLWTVILHALPSPRQ